jgi:hypothetical protein
MLEEDFRAEAYPADSALPPSYTPVVRPPHSITQDRGSITR